MNRATSTTMRKSILFLCSLSLLLCTLTSACGDNSPEPEQPGPDAGPGGPDGPLPDGPPPPPSKDLVRLDWRTTRGAPYPTTTADIPFSELFALSDNSFVTRSGCLDMKGCTYAWRDLAGAELMRKERMTNVTSSIVSPDGRRALLVAMQGDMEACDDGELIHQVARGLLQVLDLATGAVGFELDLRTNLWSSPAFTPDSDYAFAAPIDGAACIAASTGHRAVAAPYAPPPGLPATAQFIFLIDLRRWVVFFDHNLGIVDPLVAGSFTVIAESPDRYELTRGWVNAFYGFGELAQEVVSIAPDGARKQTTFRDEDWFAFGSTGRWIRVCRALNPSLGYRDCRVADALGQAPSRDFRVSVAADHPDDAVLLAAGAVVFVGPTPEGARAVQRIDLVTGAREVLHPGIGELRALGDGEAALLIQGTTAWLIDADREEKVADNVNHVLTNYRLPFSTFHRQDELAVIAISKDSARFTLAFLDVRTRRLATVTDRLSFSPRRGVPFFFFDNCSQPWTTRHGGRVVEGLVQPPQQLYFVEEGTPATMWLVPVNLSSPPRRLGELSGNPASCHTPFGSPSGARFGFSEDLTGQTTRVQLSVGQ
jgi:hypothetical protein